MNKKVIYAYDMRTGITQKFESKEEAAKALTISNIGIIAQALTTGYTANKRYKFSERKLPMRVKGELYSEYWAKQADELVVEKWAEPLPGVYVSNLGRAKTDTRVLFPIIIRGNGAILIKVGKKLENLKRLIAEAFILGRPLAKGELVIRRAGMLSYAASDLYVGTNEDILELANRTNRREVALLDDKGEVLEIYASIREGARANYLDETALCKSLKNNSQCCGLTFKYAESVY